MSGLILLILLIFWGFISFCLATIIVRTISNSHVKLGVNIVLTMLLFIVPVADEIIGGFQFRDICRHDIKLMVNEEKARGKTISDARNRRVQLPNYILPISKSHQEYKDIESGEVLISWNIFYAEGGWLSHLIGFPDGYPPYTFDGNCDSDEAWSLIEKLNMKITNIRI